MPTPQPILVPASGDLTVVGPDKTQIAAAAASIPNASSQGFATTPTAIAYPVVRPPGQQLYVEIHNAATVAVELQVGVIDLTAAGATITHWSDAFRCAASADAAHHMWGFPGGNGMRVRVVTLEGPSGATALVDWKVYAV